MSDAAAVAAIIPAAGSGLRLGADIPKAFVEVGGLTLLARAAHAMSRVADIIIVAAPADALDRAASLLSEVDAEIHVVTGGEQRQDSVAAALRIVPEHIDVVLVHDAARAFVPQHVVTAVVDALRGGAVAAIPTLPVVDTLRRVTGEVAGEVVERSELQRVQTPQGFHRDVLIDAYARATRTVTDDAALVAACGHIVHTVPGSERAFKVTTSDDLVVAAAYAGATL